MSDRVVTVLPVYNEADHVVDVLDEVRRHSREIVVVDDGSTDETPRKLAKIAGVHVLRHATNRGYGAALKTAFRYAVRDHYEVVVTIDCDRQHEPQRIGEFVRAVGSADIVSGSRYLRAFPGDSVAPAERRRINHEITGRLNHQLGMQLTDAFCGFKAYRTCALRRLRLTQNGYAMPLELWVQAARLKLTIVELPVPLIYLDQSRSFGGSLDNGGARLAHYQQVLDQSIEAAGGLESQALDAISCPLTSS